MGRDEGALRGRPAASFRASGVVWRSSGSRLEGLESRVAAHGRDRAIVRPSGAPRGLNLRTPQKPDSTTGCYANNLAKEYTSVATFAVTHDVAGNLSKQGINGDGDIFR
ncbi:MAG: hypothetical protein BroJett001_32520 [Chloroflexota bacterium]|nr:MAG: hypothetical protein BroJett001_32520 [Chloroflexota bacterium]